MDGDGREYGFAAAWLRYVGGAALVIAAMIALTVLGPELGTDVGGWAYAVPVLVVVVAVGWTVARNLVLSADLRGDRLRARTPLTRHDLAVADLTEISWRVDESRIAGLNPLNRFTARLRYPGRTLRVLMPAGAALLRDLESARAAAGGPADQLREFDYTARVHSLLAGPTTIRYATLDGRRLHAVTGDGQEHDVPLDTIEDIDEDRRDAGASAGEVMVHHRGGVLRIAMPVGAELADRLLATRAAP